MSHEPECDEAWKWPDFMSGRGIEDEHCWMCGLIRRVRADEKRKDAEHADCRCNELEAMAIVDGKYESVAINGQVLERRDVVLQEARDAVRPVQLSA